MSSAAAIVADPTWHAHRTNAPLSEVQFVRLPREVHRSITFLEEKYFPADLERIVLPMEQVREAAAALPAPPPRLILHSSMATSTLLARVFDLPGTAMCLAEPIILNELSALKMRGIDVRPVLDTVLKLLSRPFAEGEATVIKPGNTANNLIPDIVAVRPDMRAVIIHARIADFLRSVAKKGMVSRIIYRRMYAFVSRGRRLDTGFSPEDIFEQTDFQIAAMGWLHQHAEFNDAARAWPDRFRTIDSQSFLDRKADTLRAAADHFGLALDGDAIAAGPVFKTHSKERGRAFDDDQRAQEYARTQDAYGDEIDMVAAWIEAVGKHVDVPMVLPAPLLG